jgi:queuine tRNA-ribosyltransferase subunit QTRTD1
MPPFRVLASDAGARVGAYGAMETPTLLLQTNFGSPPYLMRDLQSSLPLSIVPAAALRYPHFWSHDAAVAATGKNMSAFASLQGRLTVLTLLDPGRPVPSQGGESHLDVQTWFGRRPVKPAEYLVGVSRMRPDLFVSFSDEVTPAAGNNRTRAAAERSYAWLEATLSSPALSGQAEPLNCLAFVPCAPKDVDRSAAVARVVAAIGKERGPATPAAVVRGVALGQLPGPEEACGSAERARILASVLPVLPPALLRLLPGVGGPLDMLDAIASGVDVLDGDYTDALTTAGCAAAFVYVPGSARPPPAAGGEGGGKAVAFGAVRNPQAEEGAALAPPLAAAAPAAAGIASPAPSAAMAPRKPSVKGFGGGIDAATAARHAAVLGADSFRLRLTSVAFAADRAPLVPGCGCFACAGAVSVPGATGTHPGHSRAYVHHLLTCQEMLGPVLLAAHNAWHVGAFLAAVRAAVREGRFAEYVAWFKAINAA